MKLSSIKIENFKGLKCCEANIADFTCIIGKNNAGKSTFLQALELFVSGSSLSEKDFYDSGQDILITVVLGDITKEDLDKISEHRDRIEPYIVEQQLILARRYSTDGKSKLRLVTKVPKEEKFRKEAIDENFKGKKGNELAECMQTIYPELPFEGSITTQKQAKEIIQGYIDNLEDAKKIETDIDLPSGFDNSIRKLLPEPIYIPAVKDLSDDMTTKTSASFGKLLQFLLGEIEDEFAEAKGGFADLERKLNRFIGEDQIEIDERIEKIKQVESALQRNLNESFKDVSIELRIPPPELKTIFSKADIIADDGVKGSVNDKGDGFKRAITFSIFRTYSELSKLESWEDQEGQEEKFEGKFLLLFEEPELYLHPQAQNIMFEALSLISKKNQVIVSTHSPMFFSADSTKAFIKIDKVSCNKPYGTTQSIDLTEIGEKDKFQIISFESSNQAFFSDKIVLVEGDTEIILLPHLSKTFNPDWDFKSLSIGLVPIGGKGRFQLYKDFFARFNVPTYMICDLDILDNGFDKIDPKQECKLLRDNLLKAVDACISENGLDKSLSNKKYAKELERGDKKSVMKEIREARANEDNGLVVEKLEEFFSFEMKDARLAVSYTHLTLPTTPYV
jgi:predicted ATP-dependent endonuclease of OLD family